MGHPLYEDPALVRQHTLEHIAAGRTVFQVWQIADNEQAHSIDVMDIAAPPHRARVLDLGCGIGGMTAYWQGLRSDITYDLVNDSQEQLDLAVGYGLRICMDAQALRLAAWEPKWDLVVMAYLLGHVNARRMRALAKLASKGRVLVLDVFDASDAFKQAWQYDAPTSDEMRAAGFKEVPGLPWRVIKALEHEPHVREATPGLWIWEKP